MSQQF